MLSSVLAQKMQLTRGVTSRSLFQSFKDEHDSIVQKKRVGIGELPITTGSPASVAPPVVEVKLRRLLN
jgi:hypothetical protein